jgi:hypothetical protein
VPGTACSSGSWARSVSLSMPNCEGVPIIRMLPAATAPTVLILSRQSMTTPNRLAMLPARSRSLSDSTENSLTPSTMAVVSSLLVLPGPVYRHSSGAKPASSAVESSPTEQTSARHGGHPPASRRAAATAGCGFAFRE